MEAQLISTAPLSDPLQGLAEHQAIGCLLNCYLREFALPAGQVEWRADGDLPKALTSTLLAGEALRLSLPESGVKLALKADRVSLLGRARFSSAPFIKRFGQPWRPLSALDARRLLLQEMALQTRTPYNRELADQLDNSIGITRAFLAHARPVQADRLLESEQALLWGHPMHPSPKSRHGVPMDALLACSPEVGARFPLCWFRVDDALWQHRGEPAVLAMLEQLAGAPGLYPCHPWEVRHILDSSLYRRAEQRGLIEYLGPRGLAMWPTSSVRTLYRADLPYFLKCSIHVRLTNCVRKNAWYELESAVFMSECLAPVLEQLERTNPGFVLMREPAATSLDFSSLAGPAEQADVQHLQECFGLLYRDNLAPNAQQACEPTLAGALFAWDRFGQSQLVPRLTGLARERGWCYRDAALNWFDAYLRALVPGVLDAFFNHGVVFEPHLQNTLIGFDNGLPSRVWIRDLEGTKLLPELWPEQRLQGLSERARASVYYPRAQGWNRIGYCLLVNNLSEAIFHLADGSAELEQAAWQRLSSVLRAWADANGRPEEIADLLAGGPLPSKNNLKTRLLQKADRQADYTLLAHPMRASA
ncbi:IucA/IucC family protein [Zobellella maritima]|uniref:IucA/IucC family protein n=1 Tax=Zobellella maritima TaxID=2059725 RepID=UPI000E302D43|nr:IucA/IucC family protein [Zobellella maritima]